MSRNLRRFSPATPLLVLSLLTGLMSLPDANSNLLDLLRPTVRAATEFTVNSIGDGADNNLGDSVCNDGTGACTFRAAIQQANSLSGIDIIGFSLPPNSIITFNDELDAINSNLVINGPGANTLTVQRNPADGTPNFRIFTIDSGTTVTIRELTIANGLTASSGNGGGILNSGTLFLTNVNVSVNRTGAGVSFGAGGFGGGIYSTGPLTISDSTISDNQTGAGGSGSSGGYGGGIYSLSSMTLTNSTVSGNQTGGAGMVVGTGGGIFNAGTLNLVNSSVNNNQTASGAPNGDGGGIHNVGTLTLSNSSVSNNKTSSGNGGGIYSDAGTITLTNSIISGNETNGAGGGVFSSVAATITNCSITNNASQTGGGLAVNSINNSNVVNSTISGNRSTSTGGGIWVAGACSFTSSTITNNRSDSDNSGSEQGGGIFPQGPHLLSNSMVVGNFRGTGTTADDITDTVDPVSSFNLIGTGGSGGLSNGVNNNYVGIADAHLGPLANNGGPTLTHALLVGSPAIDAGNSSLTTDQRGQPRPIDDQIVVNAAGGNASDIGAFEAHILEVNSTADADDGLCRPLGTGNACTLREAINASNAEVGVEIITFAPALTSGGPATITLLTEPPSLSGEMTISGPGANLLTVQRSMADGTPKFRIFNINQITPITISGMTIANGHTEDGVPANLAVAVAES